MARPSEPLGETVLRGEWRVEDRRRRRGALVLHLVRTRDARLTERQAQVLARIARGESLKEIGAAFGIGATTVSNHLRCALERIGATRAEAAMLVALERAAPRASSVQLELVVDFSGAGRRVSLTPAERDVVRGVLLGMSNAAIARVRRRATRTIANLLARVFRKLGVQSRSELRALHASGGAGRAGSSSTRRDATLVAVDT